MAVVVSNRWDGCGLDTRQVALLRRAVETTLRLEGVPHSTEVSLTLVDDATIHQYNEKYRRVDAPTDVLAFPLLELSPGSAKRDQGMAAVGAGAGGVPPVLLGDVLVSVERAIEQAREHEVTLDREMAQLVAHGTLHLLGYDHARPAQARAMRDKERQVLQALGL